MNARQQAETRVFKRLITETYPRGLISIVCDSFDFWYMVSVAVKILKSEIMTREGKVVIRPDSGDPVKIVCGNPAAPKGSPEWKGAVQCLWEIFGGTVTSKGFKVLDSHVGLIYGDSITLERADAILWKLKTKGFAPSNVAFGIGSFTYNFNTRDTFGFAVKSTYGVVNGKGREIFKDPITDNGIKKSAVGLLKVVMGPGGYTLLDKQSSLEREPDDCLEEVFRDGKLLKVQSLSEIKERLRQS